MAIFVTGGAGYIGSHTCLELLRRGYEVVAADNFSNSKPTAVDAIKSLSGKDMRFYEADVRDGAALDKIFTENAIDCVIHFAGLKAVGESVGIPLAYYKNNVDSTISLCEAMKRHGVKRFIFSSSATVYSADNPLPWTESARTGDCSSPYGWTKFMCERVLTDAANAEGDWSVALLRYFNPIGADVSGDIGEDPQGIPNNLMPYIAQTAIGKLEFLPIYGDDYPTPDGTCIRDYIHVVDLAAGHVAAINYVNNNVGASVFNLGTGKGTSVTEMVTAFESATGITLSKKVVGRRAGDLPEFYAATDKAERELGWKAVKTVGDACADTWRWQSKNPMGFA